MLLKGTQRRLAVAMVAAAALKPIVLVELPASAFPPGHKVFTFNFKVASKSRIAKLKQTISPPIGTFKGGLDVVTGQLNGGLKLPNTTFAVPQAGLGSVTAAMTQVKPVTGQLDLKTNKITATTTFVIKIVSAYASGATASRAAALPTIPVTLPTIPVTLPTLPVTLPTLPVTLPSITLPGTPPPGTPPTLNLVGKSCVTSKSITMTLKGTAKPTSGSTLLGTYTIPKFKSCGSATTLLNQLLPGPGNTFAAMATPASSTTTLPITLPSLPITLPTLPITLPTLPVTLPTLPVTLPTLPVTVPTLPVTVPTLPVTVPTIPGVTLPPTTLPHVTVPTIPLTLPTIPLTLPTIPVTTPTV